MLLDTELSSNVASTLLHIYFDQQTGKNSGSIRNLKLFDFF